MTPHMIRQYLDSFINFESGIDYPAAQFFELQRIENLLKALDQPQRDFSCIHVAGTKGKGSTCAFTAHILEKAGYKVGLYTSPHLKDLKERIRLLRPNKRNAEKGDIFPDGISYSELGLLIENNKSILEEFRSTPEYGMLTFFEVVTALAFLYFRQQAVDFAVLETGLGGRLDATNVVDPLVCGLTPISLEHTRVLGGRIEMIAAEKAAIIKAHKPVIVAPQKKAALDVVKEEGRRQKARLYFIGEDITFNAGQSEPRQQSFYLKGLRGEYRLSTHLLGEHQMINAATAVGMIEALAAYDIDIPPEAISQGVAETFWPCRFEILRHSPWVVLDAAHNPESIRALAQTVQTVFPGRKIVVILGMSSDKDIRGICQNILGVADEVILSQARHPRAYVFDADIKKIFAHIPTEDVPDLADSIELALTKIRKDDVLLITGSVFVAAQAREVLLKI